MSGTWAKWLGLSGFLSFLWNERMTAQEVIAELKALGNPSIKKVLARHGAREPFFGVSVADLKKVQKRLKKDHALALELYDTGISDAMYLAGLIVDDPKMTKKDLNRWVNAAYWSMLSEATVAWVAAESPHGWATAREWIDSPSETVAAASWATLGSLVSIRKDEELDLKAIEQLLKRVSKSIHDQPNRVRYTMNGFVIDVGRYVAQLTAKALEAADRLGLVEVDLGGTACEVSGAREYIEKAQVGGSIGKKRKTAKC
jgi:3-methyladenine DNA glycosylase AlkD